MEVLPAGGNVQFYVIGIEGDMGEEVKMNLCVEEDGDVILSLIHQRRGKMDIQFCTGGPGGGKNPEITRRLRELAEFLAEGGKGGLEGRTFL